MRLLQVVNMLQDPGEERSLDHGKAVHPVTHQVQGKHFVISIVSLTDLLLSLINTALPHHKAALVSLSVSLSVLWPSLHSLFVPSSYGDVGAHKRLGDTEALKKLTSSIRIGQFQQQLQMGIHSSQRHTTRHHDKASITAEPVHRPSPLDIGNQLP